MAIDSFNPVSLSIRALFNNDDSMYSIPSYQRPYRWTDKNILKLWEDLENASKNTKEDYFLGSIITAEKKGTRYVDVIDGQQRLTTLVILFSVIRDFYPDLNKESEHPLAIKALYIKKSIITDEGARVRIERLRPDDNAASDFQRFVTSDGATKKTVTKRSPTKENVTNNGVTKEIVTKPEISEPSNAELKGDDPQHNFIQSVLFFADKMDALSPEKREKFVDFIFNRVKVIQIKCDGIKSAATLFQVLNDRGLSLRPSDLIKAFLIGEVNLLYDGTSGTVSEESKLLKNWQKTENDIANHNNMTMDSMLWFYVYHREAETPGENIYKKFQKCYNDFPGENDPNAILNDINAFSEHYKTLINRKDKALYALRLTEWPKLWASILLTALHTEYSDFTQLIKVLRRYYYWCWIAGRTFATVKHPSSEVIKMVKKGKSAEDIDMYLLNKHLRKTENSILTMAKANIEFHTIDKEKWLKPLLLMIEYDSDDGGKLSFIERDKSLHLEHVFPMKHKNIEGWEHVKPEIVAKYMRSTGNLTLLSGAKNIAASNKPFAQKLVDYKGKGPEGKPTAFAITQKIMDKEHGEQWDEQAMKHRQEWFLTQVVSILEADLIKY